MYEVLESRSSCFISLLYRVVFFWGAFAQQNVSNIDAQLTAATFKPRCRADEHSCITCPSHTQRTLYILHVSFWILHCACRTILKMMI